MLEKISTTLSHTEPSIEGPAVCGATDQTRQERTSRTTRTRKMMSRGTYDRSDRSRPPRPSPHLSSLPLLVLLMRITLAVPTRQIRQAAGGIADGEVRPVLLRGQAI